jgi:hypothetical protein
MAFHGMIVLRFPFVFRLRSWKLACARGVLSDWRALHPSIQCQLPPNGQLLVVRPQTLRDRLRVPLEKFLVMFAEHIADTYFLPFYVDWIDLLPLLNRDVPADPTLPLPSYSLLCLLLRGEYHVSRRNPGEHEVCTECAVLHRLPYDEFVTMRIFSK